MKTSVQEIREWLNTETAKQNLELSTDLEIWKAEAERLSSGYDQLKRENELLRWALLTIRDESTDLGACECAADALIDSRK